MACLGVGFKECEDLTKSDSFAPMVTKFLFPSDGLVWQKSFVKNYFREVPVLIMYRRFRDLWYTYTIKMVANQNLLFGQPLIKNNFVLSDCEWKDMRKTVMLSRL